MSKSKRPPGSKTLPPLRLDRREESESPPRGSAPEETTSAPRSRLAAALAQVARLGAEVARLEQQHAQDATRIGEMLARVWTADARGAELEAELAAMQTRFVDAVQHAAERDGLAAQAREAADAAEGRAEALQAKVARAELAPIQWPPERGSGPRVASRPPPAGGIEVRQAATDDVDRGWEDR